MIRARDKESITAKKRKCNVKVFVYYEIGTRTGKSPVLEDSVWL